MNHYKILIIDDDPTLCLIAEKKLAVYGYQVITAMTGQQGIQSTLELMPDLLLLDYELPDMSGLEVCRQLRNDTNSVDKPILFIAGKNDYKSIENAFQAGATDFSSKPLNWTILNYRIQYMLRTHELYLSLLSSEARLTKAQKMAKIANWEYSQSDKSFKYSDTLYDILEIDKSIDKTVICEKFLVNIPAEEQALVRQAMTNCIEHKISFEIEHALLTSRGKKIISHIGNVIKNDASDAVDCIGTLQDITERRQTENQIRTLAYYDSLTGLMNREAFLSVLDETLMNHQRDNLLSALLFIDLDDFKRVNDTLGHNTGDLLLCEIAQRLSSCVRTAEQSEEYLIKYQPPAKGLQSDAAFRVNPIEVNRFNLGRLGGDEFTVFLGNIISKQLVTSVANRLLASLEQPFLLDGHELFVTFSIGIALAPDDGVSIHSLLKNADTAMYSAKAQGKNNFQFYTPELSNRSLYRLAMESDLRNAIANDELFLVYQPQFNLQTGKMVGAEALLRWTHKNKGEIVPNEFIPLAEQTGLILVIGSWVFEQFSATLHLWKQQGLLPETFKLALNVSSLQFHQVDMMQKVRAIFADQELNKYVEFELTESVMMTNAEANLSKLNELVAHNISLAVDDFGTGYSSLSYLHSFPVNTVKIDRSFISNMENDGQINIVKAVIAMAHGMEIQVVAEGIENQWQLDFLKAEGCDTGQGFFFAKPMTTEKFTQLLQQELLNYRS
jgi:predicted signal transduction protein with EAL and GGDEF domain/DNA-binding response OmpR family regulator